MRTTTGGVPIYLAIFLAWVCLIVNVCLAIDDEQAWLEYKNKFNKTYSSPEDEEVRKRVFLDNLRFIESHNTKAAASFTQGVNHLSDLTTEEINKSRCGFVYVNPTNRRPIDGLLEALLVALNETAASSPGQAHLQPVNLSTAQRDQQQPEQEQHFDRTEWNQASETRVKAWYDDLLSPPKLDWRTQGRVSRVKDQGACGSCWAFATTGAIEAILARQNRSTLLSEQNLVDCSTPYGNHGCSGGMMDLALRYVREHGIMASADYPYIARDSTCKLRQEKIVTHVTGSAVLPHGNENLLRLALALAGPLPVAIDAGGRSFHSYKSGVYNDGTCRNTARALNHAVLLVGYGTDKAGGDYWIVVSMASNGAPILYAPFSIEDNF